MRLKELRKEANLTQTELAEKLNLSRANLSRYEIGKVEPDIATLCLIADFFGVSVDYLIGHKTDSLDVSFYSSTAKNIINKLPNIKEDNLKKLDAICEGLIIANN